MCVAISSLLFFSPKIISALLVATFLLICAKKKKKPQVKAQAFLFKNGPPVSNMPASNQKDALPKKNQMQEPPKNVMPDRDLKPNNLSKSDRLKEDKSAKKPDKEEKKEDLNEKPGEAKEKIDEKPEDSKEKSEKKIQAADKSTKSKQDDGSKKVGNEEKDKSDDKDSSGSSDSNTDVNANEKSKSTKKKSEDKSKKKSENQLRRRGLSMKEERASFTWKIELGKRLAVKIKSTDCSNYEYDPVYSFLEPDATSILTIEHTIPSVKNEEMAVLYIEAPADAKEITDAQALYKSMDKGDPRITTTDIPMIGYSIVRASRAGISRGLAELANALVSQSFRQQVDEVVWKSWLISVPISLTSFSLANSLKDIDVLKPLAKMDKLLDLELCTWLG
uniref:Uncharacterized protein n=1 Tax=Ditylenchus dipsaci TaxID=166011 RepID=A0A915E982_9BILA